jgi:hypothetical protein
MLMVLPFSVAAFKPMSVPLIANEPGNDVWLARTLLEHNGGAQKEIDGSMTDLWAYITIDGTRKHFMGDLNHAGTAPLLVTRSLTVNCTQTIFIQADSSIQLTTTFTAPKLVDELDAISRTINYITFDVASADAAAHTVQIVFTASSGFTVGSESATSQTLDFGSVGAMPVTRHLLVGHPEVNPVKWMGATLRPWWNRAGNKTYAQTFTDAESEYQRLFDKCKAFDARVRTEAIAAGDTCYADLCGQTWRQTFNKCKLVTLSDGTPFFACLEGCSGNLIQTVDVVFPQSPMYLAYSPGFLKMMIDPVYRLFEGTPAVCNVNGPPPHDLGPWPTVNNGCNLGYWVEECSNMMIMTTAVAHLGNDVAYVQTHWAQVSRWANWLRLNGLDPASQNSTDDFTGSYPHSCLLATKALLGIACYIKMANMVGRADSAAKYRAILDTATAGVIRRGYDYQNRHFKKANDQPGSWSQKYNLIWDKALGLNVFHDSIAANEMRLYLSKLNRYGVPLLSGVTYNKSDWELWSATITNTASDFLALMHAEWNYTNENALMRYGICDWHGTTDFLQNNFGGRGVSGGYFMRICADRCMGQVADRLPQGSGNTEPRLSITRVGNMLQVAGAGGRWRVCIVDACGRIVRRVDVAANRGDGRVTIAELAAGQYTAIVKDRPGRSQSMRLCIAH